MEIQRPTVVIVGAGFGGLNAARALRRAPVKIVLIDRNNYHLFQPLLYQLATAGVSEDEIAYPVRAVFRNQENLEFRLAEVTDVDFKNCCLQTTSGEVPYQFLILAIGSETNFFGIESVCEHGYEMKGLGDAEAIRNHSLRMLEWSNYESDRKKCDALRTFVIVGGGPTGVEYAGALSELIRLVLAKDFPFLNLDQVRVILLEMMDEVLPGFPEGLRKGAREELEKKHVQVKLGTTVTDYDGEKVTLKSGETIRARTLVWAAGVKAERLAEKLDVEKAKQGRIVVEKTLQLPDHPEVFIIGDVAYLEEDGKPLPMLAPVAIQQAKAAATSIQNILSGKEPEQFDYTDPGNLATIGRNYAVARIKNFKFQGFFAWVVWLVVHIFWLIGFRNRVIVMINWAMDYIFYERAVRLVTPCPDEARPRT
jgi:NADH dehydrogenase